jgi:transglutaminase-like putative cysteine protease
VRPERLRGVLRDLSAACAFGAMAISGLLPLWVLAVFAIALFLSLCGVRLFSANGVLSALLLFVCALAIGSLVLSGAQDPVIAACTFAGLLTVNRMLSETTTATDHQVHLASLLMLSGGAALSADLLFAVCVLGFVPLATSALVLGVVARHAGPGEQVATRRLVPTIAGGSGAALVLGTALFLLLPRLSWNLAGRRPGGNLGAAVTGFSDRVQLGGDGSLKRDLRPIARVLISPDPGVDSLDQYWVGRAFEHFDGTQWWPTTHRGPDSESVTLAPGGKHVVRQFVELLPAYGSRTLIALERPIFFGGAVGHAGLHDIHVALRRMDVTEVQLAEPASAIGYYAYSLPPRDEPLGEEERKSALSLPSGLDPRIPELARTVGGQGSPAEITERLRRFLHDRYQYSLELNGSAPDPLADFLFVRKAGHCEHFATALTVLLRERGIPARVVSGFYGGDRVDGRYVLHAGDAHAWTEAYLDGLWTRFDATPDDSRGVQASAWVARLSRAYDWVDAYWRSHVVDFSINDQLKAIDSVSSPKQQRRQGHIPTPDGRWALAALLVAGLYLAWRGLRDWRRSERHAATRLLARAEKLLDRHGHRASPGAGLEELAAMLEAHRHPAGPAARRLTRRYLEARFGQSPLGRGEARVLLSGLARALAGKTEGAGPTSLAPPGEASSRRSA